MFTLATIVAKAVNYVNPPDERMFWDWYNRTRQNKKDAILEVNKGSQVYILKQDPSVHEIGARMKWIRDDIKSGPKTDAIVIAGLSRTIQANDGKNNFLYHPNMYTEEFDALNVLGILCNVLRMYKKTLKDLNGSSQFSWQWGKEPIKVYPNAGEMENAYYSRDEKALKFFYFRSRDGKMVNICKSFDIVAHEMGHAILDTLRPQWTVSDNPYSNALHESIADITAIFAILDDLDLCDSVVTHSKGNLHEHSFFAVIAEEFGTALGYSLGLRNADTNQTLQSVSSEMHDLSKVFTSAVYDILADLFDEELQKNDFEEPAIILHTVGRALFTLLVKAIIYSPKEDATFYDLAKLMLSYENDTAKWLIMNKYFRERQILDPVISKRHNEETFKESLKVHLTGKSQSLCSFNTHNA